MIDLVGCHESLIAAIDVRSVRHIQECLVGDHDVWRGKRTGADVRGRHTANRSKDAATVQAGSVDIIAAADEVEQIHIRPSSSAAAPVSTRSRAARVSGAAQATASA